MQMEIVSHLALMIRQPLELILAIDYFLEMVQIMKAEILLTHLQ